MNISTLFDKFNKALFWNGLFYSIYKILFVTLSFTLYHKLSSDLFSLWALSNSILFLLLLWLDCGFKKSIARFCPAFAKNRTVHKQFVIGLVLFQCFFLLIIGIPVLLLTINYFKTLHILKTYLIGTFILEGIVAVITLVYHAHFWQKQFNILHTGSIVAQMGLNWYYLFTIPLSERFIKLLFVSKIVTSIGLIVASLVLLPKLLKDRFYPGTHTLNTSTLLRQFIVHSGIMWAATFFKSLSERNVLLAYLTATLGPVSANLFKISFDASLFFQRILIKTIGVSDTALLAHIEESGQSKQLLKKGFKKLYTTIAYLVAPFFIIFLIILFKPTLFFNNLTAVNIFILATVTYFIEIILSPFERLLETQFQYTKLWIAYCPYLLILGVCFWFEAPAKLSLFWFIALLQIARLLSVFLMTIMQIRNWLIKAQ